MESKDTGQEKTMRQYLADLVEGGACLDRIMTQGLATGFPAMATAAAAATSTTSGHPSTTGCGGTALDTNTSRCTLFDQLLCGNCRKAERMLVPDLATEWFRKQKVFLDKLTPEELAELGDGLAGRETCRCPRGDAAEVRLGQCPCKQCRCSLEPGQDYFRRRLLPVRGNCRPHCGCPASPEEVETAKQAAATATAATDPLVATCVPTLETRSRNPFLLCNPDVATCDADKRRLDGGVTKPPPPAGSSTAPAACSSTPAPPPAGCSCMRGRSHASCGCLFQADGQPMASECVAARRTEPLLPRLRRKYDLRQSPQRRLDPALFRRISPEFFRILASYEATVTESCPLYGISMRHWSEGTVCCPCEQRPPGTGQQRALGDDAVATAVVTPCRPPVEAPANEEPAERKERKKCTPQMCPLLKGSTTCICPKFKEKKGKQGESTTHSSSRGVKDQEDSKSKSRQPGSSRNRGASSGSRQSSKDRKAGREGKQSSRQSSKDRRAGTERQSSKDRKPGHEDRQSSKDRKAARGSQGKESSKDQRPTSQDRDQDERSRRSPTGPADFSRQGQKKILFTTVGGPMQCTACVHRPKGILGGFTGLCKRCAQPGRHLLYYLNHPPNQSRFGSQKCPCATTSNQENSVRPPRQPLFCTKPYAWSKNKSRQAEMAPDLESERSVEGSSTTLMPDPEGSEPCVPCRTPASDRTLAGWNPAPSTHCSCPGRTIICRCPDEQTKLFQFPQTKKKPEKDYQKEFESDSQSEPDNDTKEEPQKVSTKEPQRKESRESARTKRNQEKKSFLFHQNGPRLTEMDYSETEDPGQRQPSKESVTEARRTKKQEKREDPQQEQREEPQQEQREKPQRGEKKKTPQEERKKTLQEERKKTLQEERKASQQEPEKDTSSEARRTKNQQKSKEPQKEEKKPTRSIWKRKPPATKPSTSSKSQKNEKEEKPKPISKKETRKKEAKSEESTNETKRNESQERVLGYQKVETMETEHHMDESQSQESGQPASKQVKTPQKKEEKPKGKALKDRATEPSSESECHRKISNEACYSKCGYLPKSAYLINDFHQLMRRVARPRPSAERLQRKAKKPTKEPPPEKPGTKAKPIVRRQNSKLQEVAPPPIKSLKVARATTVISQQKRPRPQSPKQDSIKVQGKPTDEESGTGYAEALSLSIQPADGDHLLEEEICLCTNRDHDSLRSQAENQANLEPQKTPPGESQNWTISCDDSTCTSPQCRNKNYATEEHTTSQYTEASGTTNYTEEGSSRVSYKGQDDTNGISWQDQQAIPSDKSEEVQKDYQESFNTSDGFCSCNPSAATGYTDTYPEDDESQDAAMKKPTNDRKPLKTGRRYYTETQGMAAKDLSRRCSCRSLHSKTSIRVLSSNTESVTCPCAPAPSVASVEKASDRDQDQERAKPTRTNYPAESLQCQCGCCASRYDAGPCRASPGQYPPSGGYPAQDNVTQRPNRSTKSTVFGEYARWERQPRNMSRPILSNQRPSPRAFHEELRLRRMEAATCLCSYMGNAPPGQDIRPHHQAPQQQYPPQRQWSPGPGSPGRSRQASGHLAPHWAGNSAPQIQQFRPHNGYPPPENVGQYFYGSPYQANLVGKPGKDRTGAMTAAAKGLRGLVKALGGPSRRSRNISEDRDQRERKELPGSSPRPPPPMRPPHQPVNYSQEVIDLASHPTEYDHHPSLRRMPSRRIFPVAEELPERGYRSDAGVPYIRAPMPPMFLSRHAPPMAPPMAMPIPPPRLPSSRFQGNPYRARPPHKAGTQGWNYLALQPGGTTTSGSEWVRRGGGTERRPPTSDTDFNAPSTSQRARSLLRRDRQMAGASPLIEESSNTSISSTPTPAPTPLAVFLDALRAKHLAAELLSRSSKTSNNSTEKSKKDLGSRLSRRRCLAEEPMVIPATYSGLLEEQVLEEYLPSPRCKRRTPKMD